MELKLNPHEQATITGKGVRGVLLICNDACGNLEVAGFANGTLKQIAVYPVAVEAHTTPEAVGYHKIADELWDVLHDLQLSVREGDPRMQTLTEQAAELLDRVEAQVKGK